jgi:hypothetical protein
MSTRNGLGTLLSYSQTFPNCLDAQVALQSRKRAASPKSGSREILLSNGEDQFFPVAKNTHESDVWDLTWAEMKGRKSDRRVRSFVK